MVVQCGMFIYAVSLLSVDADGKIKLWHISTSSCLRTMTEPSKQILACAFSPSGDRFVTAGSDTKLNVYDEKTNQIIHTLQPRYSISVSLNISKGYPLSHKNDQHQSSPYDINARKQIGDMNEKHDCTRWMLLMLLTTSSCYIINV